MNQITRIHVDHNGSILSTIITPKRIDMNLVNIEEYCKINIERNNEERKEKNNIKEMNKKEEIKQEKKEIYKLAKWIPFFESKKFETSDSFSEYDPYTSILEIKCELAGFPSISRDHLILYVFGEEICPYSILYPQTIECEILYEEEKNKEIKEKREFISCFLTRNEKEYTIITVPLLLLDYPFPLTLYFNKKL